MKKIRFFEHVLPHGVALAAFMLVTVIFFKPFFFDKKIISQHDIQQFEGSAKTIIDYREKTGEEPLWVNSMFSGMPAYLVSVKWSNGAVAKIKTVIALGIGHPVANIFCAFVSFYILLLSFGVRPYLAIGGALAFGLSSYMIVGIVAGHNARVGAIAFLPLVLAGIHLVFSERKLLGFGVTTAGLALHLRENHLQITYYLMMIVLGYGLVQLIIAAREKKIAELSRNIGLLVIAVVLAVGTYFGPFWATMEYTKYSKRGKSDLNVSQSTTDVTGLNKEYAFEFSNGILEPLTLMIPNILGGSSSNFLVQDQKSKVYAALVNSNDPQASQQLMQYTSAYWGPQRLAIPYYAGAVIIFLFALGIAFADKKYVWWLASVSAFGIILSWGSNFSSFNYFLFDYLPGYNKFRSVTFALVIPLTCMPLLGFIGLEKLMREGVGKEARKKILIALASTGGLCLLFLMFAGLMAFSKDTESHLPVWFLSALEDDRKSLLRSDAFRSLSFIVVLFVVIYFEVWKKLSATVFYAFLAIIILIDVAAVDKRFFTNENNYVRKREAVFYKATAADLEVLKDQSYYRVYDIQDYPQLMSDARSSYFHHSVGGYHGAKLRRYEDLYDTCMFNETAKLVRDAQAGRLDFTQYGILNMLNVKYIIFGPEQNNIIFNPSPNGSAWFVNDVQKVKTANDELAGVCSINTRTTAVINESEFTIPAFTADSTATITLLDQNPKTLKYQSESSAPGVAVFSEIYYPEGWKASIDGAPAGILRADFILRALAIPAGKHTIEFKFEPAAYYVGNKITMISSWIVLLTLIGSIGFTFYKENKE
jgi:hypothetical protein